MVLVQLGTNATDAFARIRAYAYSHGRTVDDVARDVVLRKVDFRTFGDEGSLEASRNGAIA